MWQPMCSLDAVYLRSGGHFAFFTHQNALANRSKDATNGAPGLTTRSKKLLGAPASRFFRLDVWFVQRRQTNSQLGLAGRRSAQNTADHSKEGRFFSCSDVFFVSCGCDQRRIPDIAKKSLSILGFPV